MHKPIILALALIFSQGLGYAFMNVKAMGYGSDSDDEDHTPVHRMKGMSLDERKFRDGQEYRAAELDLKRAALKEKQHADTLKAQELALKEREIAVREQELALQRRAAKGTRAHHEEKPAAASASHRKAPAPAPERSEEDDFQDAIAFACAWSKEPQSRWDHFTLNLVRAYNKYLREGVFTTEKIPEILERKNTILEALAIAKTMVKEGRYDSLDQKKLMLQSIKDGVTGLNFEDANAVIQNERLHHQKRK
jgi:hypothetical protein